MALSHFLFWAKLGSPSYINRIQGLAFVSIEASETFPVNTSRTNESPQPLH